jgi:hypothetical protein
VARTGRASTHTRTNSCGKAPHMGQAAGGRPGSMWPQTGHRKSCASPRSFPCGTAASAIAQSLAWTASDFPAKAKYRRLAGLSMANTPLQVRSDSSVPTAWLDVPYRDPLQLLVTPGQFFSGPRPAQLVHVSPRRGTLATCGGRLAPGLRPPVQIVRNHDSWLVGSTKHAPTVPVVSGGHRKSGIAIHQ